MNSPAPSQTTSIQKTELPEWVDAAGKANYDKAVALDDASLQQFEGPRVATQPDSLKNAFSFFNENQNAGKASTDAAAGVFRDVANNGAVSARQLPDTDLSPYLNPYIDNVENKALDALDRSRVQSLNSNADAAVSAKSFGGSRSAIIDAVTNSETARDAGMLSAGLRKEGFDTAVNNATGDITREYTANVGNRDAKMSSASGLLATGGQQQKQMLDTFAGKSAIGSIDQAQSQAEINAAREKFNETTGKEEADLNRRLAALGMTPYSSSSTTNTTGTAESRGTDWAATGLGVLSLFAGLSEDDTKTDKEKVGKVGDTDLDLWAYRYKSDPKTYPKVVGIMASDVEAKHPDAVTRVNGKRIIDYGRLEQSVKKVSNG